MKIKKPRQRDIIIFVVTLIAFLLITSFWDEIKDLVAAIFT